MPKKERRGKTAVIMPAYNAERTALRAAGSVLGQSVWDLELIAVDDGSTDGTAARLAELAGRDRRLRLLRTENRGAAAARNLALDALSPGTDYVMFLDADDTLAPGAVELALRGAASGADLVVQGFTVSAGSACVRCSQPAQLIRRAALPEHFSRLYLSDLLSQAWAKLYRAELLTGPGAPRFQNHAWGEDRLFLFDCLERARSLAVLPWSGYAYRTRAQGSLAGSYYSGKFQVCLEADRRAEALGGGRGEAALRAMFAKSVFSCLTALYSPSCPLDPARKRAEARAILENERVRRRCRDCAGGLSVRALNVLLRTGSLPLNFLGFSLVGALNRAAPGLTLRAKRLGPQ